MNNRDFVRIDMTAPTPQKRYGPITARTAKQVAAGLAAAAIFTLAALNGTTTDTPDREAIREEHDRYLASLEASRESDFETIMAQVLERRAAEGSSTP